MIATDHSFKSFLSRAALAICGNCLVMVDALAGADPVSSFEAGQSVPSISLLPILGNLVLVLSLVVAGGWFLTRARGAGRCGNRNLKVIASQPLGAKEKIVIVEIGEQQLVIGLTPSSINTLYVPDAPLLQHVSGEALRLGSFAEKLRQSMKRDTP